MSLLELVHDAVRVHKDRTAVIFDNGDTRCTCTYKELWDISHEVFQSLSRYVLEGEVVGLCIHSNLMMPAIIVGVLRAGAAFCSVDHEVIEYTRHVLHEISARVLIIQSQFTKLFLDKMNAVDMSVDNFINPWLKDYNIIILSSISRQCHSVGLAYCITTSGTTGTPKVVMVPHKCILPNIVHLMNIFGLTSEDIVLAATAMTFDPFVVEIFTALSVGALLLVVPPMVKMVPDKLLDVILNNKVTVIQMTPTLLSRFNTAKISEQLLGDNSVLRVIALGGEKFPSCNWIKKIKSARNKTKFYNLYGTTEVSCWATCYELTENDFSSDCKIPLGDVLEGTFVQVKDQADQDIEVGLGQLFIGGSHRQCILGKEEERVFDPHVIKMRCTGDIVKKDSDGQLFYVGRNDCQIKRNGQRINFDEIQQVAKQHQAVHDAVVVIISHRIVLCVVLDDKHTEANTDNIDNIHNIYQNRRMFLEDLQIFVRVRLPSHCWPDDILLIPTLPATKHGKMDVMQLQQIYEGQVTTKWNGSSIVDYLKDKWKDILGLGSTQVTCNFIESGGNSLKALHLFNAVENTLHVSLPNLLDLILHKTYGDVEHYVLSVVSNIYLKQYSLEKVNGLCGDCVNDNISVHVDKHTQRTDNNITHTEQGTDDDNIHTEQGTDDDDDDDNDVSVQWISQTQQVADDSVPQHWDNDIPETHDDDNIYKKRKLDMDHHTEIISNKFVKVCCNFNYTISRTNKLMHVENSVKSEHLGTCGDICELSDCVSFELKELWRYNTSKCVDASPLLAISQSGDQHVVYIGSHSHLFAALDLSCGKCLWKLMLPDRIESSACLSHCGQFVVVGCYDGCVYFLHAVNGDIWWQFDTGAQVKCSPTVDVASGHIYIGSHSQIFYCLNPITRKVCWKKNLKCGSIFSSPVVCYKPYCVYVATLGGRLFSLDCVTGYTRWMYNFNKPVFSSPVISHIGVYVGSTDNSMYHISHAGLMIWKYSTNGPIFSSPSYHADVLGCAYNEGVHLSDEHLTVVNEITCMLEWENNELTEHCGEEHNHNNVGGTIVFGCHDQCLYCLTRTGQLKWKLELDSNVYSSPFQYQIVSHSSIIPRTQGHLSESNTVTLHTCIQSGSIIRHPQGDLLESNTMRLHDGIQSVNSDDNNTFGKHIEKEKVLTVHDLDKQNVSTSNESKDIVMFATTSSKLYIADCDTGKILGSTQLMGEIFSSPVCYGNMVIVGCRDNHVYCFHIIPVSKNTLVN